MSAPISREGLGPFRCREGICRADVSRLPGLRLGQMAGRIRQALARRPAMRACARNSGAFKRQVLENFKYYRVPVIALDRSTSKEAVCVVFEKVNTGGKPLDAFELVTAMYAASGHELRKDWYGDERQRAGTAASPRRCDPPDARRASSRRSPTPTSSRRSRSSHTRERRRAAEHGRQAGQGAARRHRQPAGAAEPAA